MTTTDDYAYAVSLAQQAYEKYYEGHTDPTWPKQSLYYEYDTVYKFVHDGDCFEYRIIADVPESEGIWALCFDEHVKGIHYRQVEDDGTFPSWDDPLPEYEGKIPGSIFGWSLSKYEYLSCGSLISIMRHPNSMSSIESYDYNGNAKIDQEDMEIIMEYSVHPMHLTPYGFSNQAKENFANNIFYDSDAVMFFRMEYAPFMNVYSTDKNDPWIGSNYELLPLTYVSKMEGEPMNEYTAPEDAEFIIICNDAFYEGEPYWAYYDCDNPFIKFSGYSVALIEDGNYLSYSEYAELF